MSDFLGSLVDRSLGVGQILRPRIPSRFEPQRLTSSLASDGFDLKQQPDDQTPTESGRDPFGSLNVSNDPSSRNNSLVNEPRPDLPLQRMTTSPSDAAEPVLNADIRPTSASLNASIETDRIATVRGGTENTFDPRGDRWLNHRFEEMSIELQRLRGEPAVTASRQPVQPPDLNLTPRMTAPETVRTSASETLPNPIRESLEPEHPLSSVLSPNQAEPPVIASTGSEASARRESDREFFSLLAASQMQPVPKIVPEQLSAISKHSAASQPTINVTIGRVEVKATRDPVPAPRPARSPASPSVMTLQDYLQRRAAGGLG